MEQKQDSIARIRVNPIGATVHNGSGCCCLSSFLILIPDRSPI